MAISDTQRTYDQVAANYDERHKTLRYRVRYGIVERPLAKLLKAGNCLDLGCGTGRLLRGTSPDNVGIDVSRGMLREARDLKVLVADAHHLPFADHSFAGIVAANGVFRYLQVDEAFAECRRVLRPGGQLAVHQYSQRTWSLRDLKHPSPPADVRHLASPAQLTEPGERAGFTTTGLWLWRSIRVPPFALPIAKATPGHLWSHCVALFTRDSQP